MVFKLKRGLCLTGGLALCAVSPVTSFAPLPHTAPILRASSSSASSVGAATLSSHSGSENSGTAEATTQPGGVDPFTLVQTDLKNLKMHIKALVEVNIGSKDKTREGSTNPLLQEAAREFFERRERAWRPGTVLLMARALNVAAEDGHGETAAGGGKRGANEKTVAPSEKQLQLAEIVEMMVTAQVIHDDVLEDLIASEEGGATVVTGSGKGNVAHRMYSSALGNKVSLLAGDFLLARSSVQLARLTNTEVVGIIGTSLENMCRGEIMHAQATDADKLSGEYYHKKVGLKTASLLADACRCTAVLRGEDSGSARAEAAWQFGHHLSVAYSITSDSMAYRQLLAAAERALKAGHRIAAGGLPSDVASAAQAAGIGLTTSGDGKFVGPAELLAGAIGLPPFALAATKEPRLAELALAGFADHDLEAESRRERAEAGGAGAAGGGEGEGGGGDAAAAAAVRQSPWAAAEAVALLTQGSGGDGHDVSFGHATTGVSWGEAEAAALAAHHAALARDALVSALPPSTYRDGLVALTHYVVQEDQRGLQRAKWQELQKDKLKKVQAKAKAAAKH